jgi:hypothetical protein
LVVWDELHIRSPGMICRPEPEPGLSAKASPTATRKFWPVAARTGSPTSTMPCVFQGYAPSSRPVTDAGWRHDYFGDDAAERLRRALIQSEQVIIHRDP